MRVLLLQLDGKLPNIALMRVAAHHRGEEIIFKQLGNISSLRSFEAVHSLAEEHFDLIYASAIFTRTRPVAEELLRIYPFAKVGGTGWDLTTTLESIGITTAEMDYSIYPNFRSSIGFSQRGCRLKCPFCVVPKKEGAVTEEATIFELWRGDPYPRELLLLDNDFFGAPNWRRRIEELREGRFKVSFNQGINARVIDDEIAAAIASVNYRDDSMKERRLYTAWDNHKDEARLFAGLELLKKHGVKPRNIMVYMLIGYWPGETRENWEYRRARLREFGCRPYPMPYVRTRETVGFQRWLIGAYDKRVSWSDWEASGYNPRKLHLYD
jgi:hypothetical protein